MIIEKKLINYLKYNLTRYYESKKGEFKLNIRPIEFQYLHIAKACNLSYQQVRDRLLWLEKAGIIEIFRAWADKNRRKNYYRLSAGGRKFLDTL